jgi:SAM-dependent methyltransferase
VAETILGRKLPPPPLACCVIAIVDDYAAAITAGMSVLEIGAGAWSRLAEACAATGASYEGIDTQPEYFGKPTVATRIENLADLSYPENSFDLVVGNQTMEHWEENGCALAWGLFQCFRVTKPGGKVRMNVPIHFHGSRDFVLGRVASLRGLFERFSDDVTLEPWGADSAPIAPYRAHPSYPLLAERGAYTLDIVAVKDKPTPAVSRRWRPSGRVGQVAAVPPRLAVIQAAGVARRALSRR